MKTTLKKTITALTASIAMTSAAQAADVTLRFAHFWPAVSPIHKEVFQGWADAVEADSNGRIEVEIYPGATLSKPPAQYDAVINRIADMTATVQGYTANRFPLTQVVELPGVVKTAEQGSCVIQSLYEEGLIADEYKDTRPLFLFTHGQGHLQPDREPGGGGKGQRQRAAAAQNQQRQPRFAELQHRQGEGDSDRQQPAQ